MDALRVVLFNKDQPNFERFLVYLGMISNYSKFPVSTKFPEVADTLIKMQQGEKNQQ